jgi:cytochrome b561
VGLRNDSEGYGLVTKFLHWLMLGALTAQFVVGYSMVRRDEELLLPVHVALGVGILVLAVVRVLWRASGTLPQWADGLSTLERSIASWVERLLYVLMFLIPLTGLSLVLASGEDWDIGESGEWQAPFELADGDVLLSAHIATQLTFFTLLAVHIAIVLKHQLVDRDRLLNRML